MFLLTQNLFLLFCGHALCDFALQSEWVATNKNRHARDKLNAEQKKQFEVIWPWLMGAHSLHHGLAVFLFTQNLTLGLLETASHFVIDFLKCEKVFGFHLDQILHLLCKIIWVALLYYQIV